MLLDSNACIAVIRGRPVEVGLRAARATELGERIVVSSIVVFELRYGVAFSGNPARNGHLLDAFLAGIPSVPFDDDDAAVAGLIRAELRRQGKGIGPYDYLIAAQARRHDWLLVTANEREFSRVQGLRWENWER